MGDLRENISGWLATLSKRIHPSKVDDTYLGEIGYGGNSAGVNVTPLSSLRSSAVLGCYRVLTESVGSLPLHLYERLDRGKRRANEHSLYDLLRWAPNSEMTAYQWIETSVGHMMLWGNAYSEMEIDGSGKITAMVPIMPERVWPERNPETNEIQYKVYNTNGGFRIVPKWKMFHLPFLSLNGLVGISPIGLARLSVGLTVAAEEYGAAFFGNGAVPKIIIEHPGQLGEKAADNLKRSWNDFNQGAANSNKTVVLEEGMKIHALTIPPNDAQFLETRKYQVEDIARIYRVPPHMLADLDKATFSNIEHLGLEFVQHSLRSWLVRWEQGIHQQLLLKAEKKKYYAEFLVDGLLRGDIQSRYGAYATAKQWGWMSTNDILELENMNSVENGDDRWQPLNMLVVGSEPEDVPSERAAIVPSTLALRPSSAQAGSGTVRAVVPVTMRSAKSASAARRRATLAWRRVLTEASERILKKETAELRKILKDAMKERSLQSFAQELDSYYDQKFNQFAYGRMYGALMGYGEEIAGLAAEEIAIERDDVMDQTYLENWVSRYTNAFVSRHVEESRERMDAVIAKANEVANGEEVTSEGSGTVYVEEELAAWDEHRAGEEGKEESVRLNGALANKIWALAGIAFMRWKVYGDTCPYCLSLNGKIVGISENFLQAGVAFAVDGEVPLVPRQNKKHPPAHSGCDCGIEAVI